MLLATYAENGVKFQLLRLRGEHVLTQTRTEHDANGKPYKAEWETVLTSEQASIVLDELSGRELASGRDTRNVKGKAQMRTRVLTVEDDGKGGEDTFRVSGGVFVGTLNPGTKHRENLLAYCRKNGVVATATDASEMAFTLCSDDATLGKLWDMPFFASCALPIAVRIPFMSAGSGTLSPAAEKRVKEAMRPMEAGFIRKVDFEAVKDERKRLEALVVTKPESPHYESNVAVERFRAEEAERAAEAKRVGDEADAASARAEFEAKRQAVAVTDAREFLTIATDNGLLPAGSDTQRNAMLAILTRWYLVNDSAPTSLETLATFARTL